MGSIRSGVLRSLAVLTMVIAMYVGYAYAQGPGYPSTCGSLGQACCCKEGDYANDRCCGQGLQCVMFSGQGFDVLSGISQICAPKQPSRQGCGNKDGPCCLTSSFGNAAAACSNGLVCAPSSIGWASKAQYSRLSSGFAAAVKDPVVMGSCRRFTLDQCGKRFMPCGKDIGMCCKPYSQPYAWPLGYTASDSSFQAVAEPTSPP
eukprot:GHUV01020955.1.p1 GENE.GHUV01020955.1~~GHUV01020955.1.p1  ORF type:complete len:204 (+),score=14.03 GHUV01020955.1:230-841(+)